MQKMSDNLSNQKHTWFDVKCEGITLADLEHLNVHIDYTVTRCIQIKVRPTPKQRAILLQWMLLYNKVYNYGIDCIRKILRERLPPPMNDMAFATVQSRTLPEGLANKIEVNKFPARMRHAALQDAAKAFISAKANYKAGNIKRFRMRYKKDSIMSIVIRCDTFSKEENGFNIRILGEIETEPSLDTVRDDDKAIRDSRLVYKNGHFTLFVPKEKVVQYRKDKKPMCALDPGGRTFQSLYDTDGFAKICTNSYEKLTRLHDRIRTVNDGVIWSREKSKNIRYFMSKERKLTKKQEKRKENLARWYPNEIEAYHQKRANQPVEIPKSPPSIKHLSKYKNAKGYPIKRKPKHATRINAVKNRKYKLKHKKKRNQLADVFRKPKTLATTTVTRHKKSVRKQGPKNRHRSIAQKIKKINKRIRDRITHLVDDLHWKTAHMLVTNYHTILIGDMSTQGIIRSGGNLSSSVKRQFSSLRHYTFRQRLISKAQDYFCKVYVIDEYRTSKTCSRCGEVKDDLGSDKVFICDHCGHTIDRDNNGAINIMKVFGGCFNQTRALVEARKAATETVTTTNADDSSLRGA